MADTETLIKFFSLLGHEEHGLTAINIFDKQSNLKKKFYVSTAERYAEIVKQYDGPWDKIHSRLQSMNDSNHHYKILMSFNIPFIFRC